jgi:hypothetical protein
MPPKKQAPKKGGDSTVKLSAISNTTGLVTNDHSPYKITTDPVFSMGKYIPSPFSAGNVVTQSTISATSANQLTPMVSGGAKKGVKTKTTKTAKTTKKSKK